MTDKNTNLIAEVTYSISQREEEIKGLRSMKGKNEIVGGPLLKYVMTDKKIAEKIAEKEEHIRKCKEHYNL